MVPKRDFNKDSHPLPDVRASAARMEMRRVKGKTKNPKPDVTVITVVFNALKGAGETALKECLDSVQAQRGLVLEHLIIDGNSTDGTTKFLRAYTNKRHTIRLLSEPDKGIYDAMNKGIALAKGEYSIFLNSDDYLHNPDGLSASVKRLRETGCDFSYAKVIVSKDGEPVPQALHARADGRLIFCAMPFSHQSMLFRTSRLRAVNGYDNVRYRSSADYDMIERLVLSGCTACYVDCTFATFRVGGFSSQNIQTSQKECALVYSRLFSEVTGIPISPERAIRLFVQKSIPRDLKAALADYYHRSFYRWQPPLMPLREPARLETCEVESHEKATADDTWVRRITPVWEMDTVRDVLKDYPPKTEILASDVWHLYSSYLYTSDGVWTDGSLGIIWRTPDYPVGISLRVTIRLLPLSRPDLSLCRLGFAVNGVIYAGVAAKRGVYTDFTIIISSKHVKDGLLGVEVHCGDATRPSFFRTTNEQRMMGFQFHSARIEVMK